VRDHVDIVFSALADGRRRHLVEVLAERGSATATELAANMPVTRQAITKHLTSLGEAGLVRVERHGREARYQLTPDALGDATAWIEEVGQRWDTQLAALSRHLAKT
jgi:DNA-binding transcriptional ArsR family regulator